MDQQDDQKPSSKVILYLGIDAPRYFPAQVLHYPIIEVHPRAADLPDIQSAFQELDAYTHIIFTSKKTVRFFCDYLPKFGYSVEDLASKVILAVGQATALALESRGIQVDRIAQEETSEGIVQELEGIDLNDAYVFWPHSALSRSVISDFLTAGNIRFKECVLYDTQTHRPHFLPNFTEVDEIMFTSPSTVDAFLELFGAFPSNKSLSAIGPITQDYLKKKLASAESASSLKE